LSGIGVAIFVTYSVTSSGVQSLSVEVAGSIRSSQWNALPVRRGPHWLFWALLEQRSFAVHIGDMRQCILLFGGRYIG